MRIGVWFVGSLLACASAALAQLDDNTVTVTARRASMQPSDQVLIYVYVDSPPDSILDDVLAILQGSGVSASSFQNVSTSYQTVGSPGERPPLTWSFQESVAYPKLNTELSALVRIQKNSSSQKTGFDVSFSLQSAQVSADLKNPQSCPMPTLVSDAQAQAERVAAAVGMRVGAIVAISDEGARATVASRLVFDPLTSVINPFFGVVDPSFGLIGIPAPSFSLLTVQPTTAPSCSLTVQFKLL
jgi:hypothetical protein